MIANDMRLHIQSPGHAPGVYPIARRGRELKHISFTIIELGGALREHSLESGEDELALSFYTGPVRISIESGSGRCDYEVARRVSLRDPWPMAYVPAGSRLKLEAPDGPARIGISGALGKAGVAPALTKPVLSVQVGKDNWQRMVYTHVADNIDAAHLIAGETVGQPGGWSSCPPHKHDRFGNGEVPMEEIYYFQCDPPQGFGFMRVYTAPDDPEAFDEAYPVQHGDTVLIPRGYHPVVACPGYTLMYTWVLAGEGRKYGAWSDDPRHAWIKG
jgi:5-deoxy-glucuronate isomerase